MPYRWQSDDGGAPAIAGASFHGKSQQPLAVLHLSAHNSLTAKGFVIVIGITFALILVPLLAVLGSLVFWVLLPFMMAALAALWWALKFSWANRDISETLTIWTDRTELSHRRGKQRPQTWTANTYWVAAHIHVRRGPHAHYITLTGSPDGREVELGSFLTEDERRDLIAPLQDTLSSAAAASIPL